MTETHLSIGEVLGLLQGEFPDVTISKIRFLESQGLIDPERTPSGYRKFYTPDIDRLRWILVQQRENFLPLKVIKERLDASNGIPKADEQSASTSDAPSTTPSSPDREPGASSTMPAPQAAKPAVDASGANPTVPSTDASKPPEEGPYEQQPIWMADLAASKGARSIQAAASMPLDAGPTEVSLTATELCSTAGISLDSLRELEQYGLLSGRSYGDDIYYDGDSLLIATRSAAFLGHGIGARHLRMFKVAAEREAGFLEQVVMPMLKQRNPEARRQAVELVEELAELGHDLRAALLRSNLRRHLDRS